MFLSVLINLIFVIKGPNPLVVCVKCQGTLKICNILFQGSLLFVVGFGLLNVIFLLTLNSFETSKLYVLVIGWFLKQWTWLWARKCRSFGLRFHAWITSGPVSTRTPASCCPTLINRTPNHAPNHTELWRHRANVL